MFANPTAAPVTERVMVANAMLTDDTPLANLLEARGAKPVTVVNSGMVSVTVPAETTLVLGPVERDHGGYGRYKRVK